MFTIKDLPQSLFRKENLALLSGILRGVERECLRTNGDGELARSAHPAGLGSALTHPQITTDFSEALLEFITPPSHCVDDLIAHLDAIHKYAITHIGDEILWTNSMPCALGEDAEIPVAQYGDSHNGKMKTIYRIGLGHRYGRSMQTVSGVHYNFSLPNAFWALLAREENSILDLQAFKNTKYFSLIRNFRRHYWLLIYLFGASPAMCSSFVKDRQHDLLAFDDEHTLHLPYATSLRMGDLGYQSSAQESLYVCYNEQASYIKTLCSAITTPYPTYEKIGVKQANGNYAQLNTGMLQIENEFYSAIRPKRTTQPGETALAALGNRGVEYIEVRCLDVDPFTPLGMSKTQIHFIDCFLLYCALQESPLSTPDEGRIILENQKRVVKEGRRDGLTLNHPSGESMQLSQWGESLVDAMSPIANLLDEASNSSVHRDSLNLALARLRDSELTPSAKILATMRRNRIAYPDFALALSKENREKLLSQPLSNTQLQRLEHMALESIAERGALEENSAKQDSSFDAFLAKYYAQYDCCSKQ